jgi:hypothetical protein
VALTWGSFGGGELGDEVQRGAAGLAGSIRVPSTAAASSGASKGPPRRVRGRDCGGGERHSGRSAWPPAGVIWLLVGARVWDLRRDRRQSWMACRW